MIKSKSRPLTPSENVMFQFPKSDNIDQTTDQKKIGENLQIKYKIKPIPSLNILKNDKLFLQGPRRLVARSKFRDSIKNKIKLDDDTFKEQKKKWEQNELANSEGQ